MDVDERKMVEGEARSTKDGFKKKNGSLNRDNEEEEEEEGEISKKRRLRVKMWYQVRETTR